MALYRFAIDHLAGKGFLLVLLPVLAGERAMYGTGFLPTQESNLYRLEKDDLYLTGTSEVALAGLHMDERLEEEDLPARYVGFTTNFRREAGAAGKDTKGMFRAHQFDKVEMFVYCVPEESSEIHELLLSYEEEIAQALGLPYRVMNIAVGDLGAPAAKKYDIEAWFPAQRRYREITSCSNTTDYQARRLNIRFRRERELQFAHTLNGTGATARSLLSIMENFQDDGAWSPCRRCSGATGHRPPWAASRAKRQVPRPGRRTAGQQGASLRGAEPGAGIPARPGRVGAVAAAGDVAESRRGRARGHARVQLRLDQPELLAGGLGQPADQRRPQRGDGAGTADHRGLAVHQDLVAGGRVGAARHVGHAPAGRSPLPPRPWPARPRSPARTGRRTRRSPRRRWRRPRPRRSRPSRS